MKFIGDFHIHSHYSRATSKFLTPEHLDYWARLKGIKVVGTGDCQHPGWYEELSKKLEKCDNGLYRLKKEFQLELPVPKASILHEQEVYFVPTTEISNIYKKYDKVRKVHNVCIFPDLDVVKWFQEKLELIGNIRSDGRPILGLDSRDLLAITLESSESSIFIPAHIWTPWFSALGSKSGFDSIEECFGDLTPFIHAVETGLSSDPPMNRICSILDKFLLVSNSDAHSPDKLGREANLFDTELTYNHIYKALQTGEGFVGTVEFYPQEGKYHYDGHRKCKTFWNPLETIEHGSICPVCGNEVTKGVMYRVAELADRKTPKFDDHTTFSSMTPLPELLSQLAGVGPKSKRVQKDYLETLTHLGSEFDIMLNADISEIKSQKNELFAEGIRRLRSGEVHVEEGYDGVFGTVNVFKPDEIAGYNNTKLFGIGFDTHPSKKDSVEFDVTKFQQLKSAYIIDNSITKTPNTQKSVPSKTKKNIIATTQNSLVVAGPGTGKTWLLHERARYILANQPHKALLALTFSNAAANEIFERISQPKQTDNNDHISKTSTESLSNIKEKVMVSTFHKYGLSLLKKYGHFIGLKSINICETDDLEESLIHKFSDIFNKKQLKAYLSESSEYKRTLNGQPPEHFETVEGWKKENGFVDLDDLIFLPLEVIKQNKFVEHELLHTYSHVLVDECQDLNAAQLELALIFAKNSAVNYMFIGDPDQSIYTFQGASSTITTEILKKLPNIATFKLEKSYRCPQPILKVASQVLRKKTPLIGNASELKIDVQQFENEYSEARSIANYIANQIGGLDLVSIDQQGSETIKKPDISFSDIAILCRTSLQFEPLKKALEAKQIPTKIIQNQSYLKHEPFKTVIKKLKDLNQNQNELKKPLLDIIFEAEPTLKTNSDRLSLNFLNIVKEHDNNLQKLLETFLLRLPQDEQCEGEAVSIMTVHAAKGLEFDTIIMPGCEDKLFPFHVFEDLTPEKVKEEERLFYVGLTRTKRQLFLSYAMKRKLKHFGLKGKASRFLNRFEEELISLKKENKTKKSKQIALF